MGSPGLNYLKSWSIIYNFPWREEVVNLPMQQIITTVQGSILTAALQQI